MPVPSSAVAYSARYTGRSAVVARVHVRERVRGRRCRRACARACVATHRARRPQRARQVSTSDAASTQQARAAVSTSAYSSAGFRFSAWLAGMVHAVVVQMTAQAVPAVCMRSSRPTAPRPRLPAAARLRAGKPTSSVWLLLSAYSISNSASAAAAVEAPVHRLQAAVDEAALDDALEARGSRRPRWPGPWCA
jgi:hypothetical protein